MATVNFTANLQRHLAVPSVEVEGETLAQVLSNLFERHPKLRSYIVDDQDQIRKHVIVFVDGEAWSDRHRLDQSIPASCEIYVMQALSGG